LAQQEGLEALEKHWNESTRAGRTFSAAVHSGVKKNNSYRLSIWARLKRLQVRTNQEEITMKFMMLMIPAVYQGGKPAPGFTPDPKKMEEMGRFNEELGKALRIESLNGLHPLAKGARVSFAKGKPSVTDGPFIETKEVLGGYWLVEAPSKEEVVKWAQRCPADEGDTIEIRQIFGPEDFAK
jgi:hypothetical protein